MIKNSIFILCILLSFFLTNCRNKSTQKKQEQIIVNLQQNKQVSIHDIFSKIDLIPIETNKDFLVENVSKLIHKDELFYILDKNQKCIFIINEEGRLVRKLDRVGKGPGEYGDISDFEINPYTNNIEILSQWGIIYIYNLNCEFIDSYKLPSKIRAVHFFTNIDSDLVAFYALFEKKSIILYSKKASKIVDNFFEVPESLKGSPLQGLRSPFLRFNEKTLFFQGFTNNIYEFSKSKLKTRYSWDFGKNNIDIKKIPKDGEVPQLVNYILSNEFVNSFFYNAENSEFISTRFVCGKECYSIFFDKNQGETLVIKEFKEQISPPYSAISNSKGLISIIEPLNINKLISPNILNEENKLKFEDIKVSDNPIIIFYHYN